MPIRNSLSHSKRAIFAIELPDLIKNGPPSPTGTGFFISPDGWFVTAAHVIRDQNDKVRTDLNDARLAKELDFKGPPIGCNGLEFQCIIDEIDFALLKVDFSKNSNKDWLKGMDGFPFIDISSRELEEGEPVYSFGYPLGEGKIVFKDQNITIGSTSLCPRVTSAIISSKLEKTKMIMSPGDPKHYVLDKALNYGNSGGPILATETGKVHAFCSRFQPVGIQQNHLKDKPWIVIPSLYGIVYSLNDPRIIKELDDRKIPISTD